MKSTGNRAYHKDGRSGVMHEHCRGAWFGVFKKILPLIDLHRDEIMGDVRYAYDSCTNLTADGSCCLR